MGERVNQSFRLLMMPSRPMSISLVSVEECVTFYIYTNIQINKKAALFSFIKFKKLRFEVMSHCCDCLSFLPRKISSYTEF